MEPGNPLLPEVPGGFEILARVKVQLHFLAMTSSCTYDHGRFHPPDDIEQFIRRRKKSLARKWQLDLYAGQNFRSRPAPPEANGFPGSIDSRLIVAPSASPLPVLSAHRSDR